MSVTMNIVIEQGTDYSNSITVTDDNGVVKDLTGYSFQGMMRKSYGSATGYTLTVSSPTPISGTIVFSVTATDSGTFPAGRYVYDIVMTAPSPSNLVTRVVEGIVTVTPGVVGPGGMSSGVITSYGSTGATGSTGPTGAQGPVGAATGPTGSTGIPGLDGLDGQFTTPFMLVTGSVGGNAALTSLLKALAATGIIINNTAP